jgi:RNA polymerase sigma-70 factor (ECF subfamily)
VALTDTDLVARVLASEDHVAFAELVRRHQSRVRAFLTRMTRGDLHLADDLAQETFLKAWKKMHTFRGNAKLLTWLLGIALNEFRDEARRRKVAVFEDAADTGLEQAAGSAAPNSNLRLDLAEALNELNLNERGAILLCCQNGLSHSEAAEVLGCPIGTVKTNVLRGKEKLKRRLSL